jgi:chaperonin GroEL
LLGGGAAGRFLVVHPPEYGHWRKALLEDMAMLTGSRVTARDLGARF